MTKQKRSRQSWWPLYALVLMMAGLLILAQRIAPSPGWRTFLEIGVVVVGYGLIALWLETHSTALLDRPSAEVDSPAVKSLQGEMSSVLSSQYYADADPAIIDDMPEHPTSNLGSNGHHPASTIPSLPEEAAKRFTNN